MISLARKLAAVTLLTACATSSGQSVTFSSATADGMIGRTPEQVAARLGPPRSNSSSVLTYQSTRSEPVRRSSAQTSLSGDSSSVSFGAGRLIYTCTWSFRLGADGRVASWSNEGDLCAALG